MSSTKPTAPVLPRAGASWPPPPEVEVDYHRNQVLALTDSGEPFRQYVECSAGCGYVIGCGDAIESATHGSCGSEGDMSQPTEEAAYKVSPQTQPTPVALVPAARGMTVSGLIDHLAQMPPDAEVVVNASDGDVEVFALVKAAEYEPTCADVSVCRLYADQEDDEPYGDDVDDGADLDPCNHCPHDNTRHRGDGCLDCGCDVPQ